MVKSKQANASVTLSADQFAKIMQQLNQNTAAVASLIDTKTTAAKPAVPAVKAPEISIEVARGKYSDGLVLRFEGRKTGRFFYSTEWNLMKKHAAEIDTAFKKLGK